MPFTLYAQAPFSIFNGERSLDNSANNIGKAGSPFGKKWGQLALIRRLSII
jgi:hypothetical protein